MAIDPLTATLLLTQVTGFGMKLFGQRQESKAQAEAAERNAAIARQQAELIRRGSRLQTQRDRKAKKTFESTQRASFAKAGVRTSGSPLELIADSATEFELDILTNEFNARVDERRVLSQAQEDARMAKKIRKTSKFQTFSTILEAGATLGKNYGGLIGQRGV